MKLLLLVALVARVANAHFGMIEGAVNTILGGGSGGNTRPSGIYGSAVVQAGGFSYRIPGDEVKLQAAIKQFQVSREDFIYQMSNSPGVKVTEDENRVRVSLGTNTLLFTFPMGGGGGGGLRMIYIMINGIMYRLPGDEMRIQMLINSGAITREFLVMQLRQKGAQVQDMPDRIIVNAAGRQIPFTFGPTGPPVSNTIVLNINGMSFRLPDDATRIQQLISQGTITREILINVLRNNNLPVRESPDQVQTNVGQIPLTFLFPQRPQPPPASNTVVFTINGMNMRLPDDSQRLQQLIASGSISRIELITMLRNNGLQVEEFGDQIRVTVGQTVLMFQFTQTTTDPTVVINLNGVRYELPQDAQKIQELLQNGGITKSTLLIMLRNAGLQPTEMGDEISVMIGRTTIVFRFLMTYN